MWLGWVCFIFLCEAIVIFFREFKLIIININIIIIIIIIIIIMPIPCRLRQDVRPGL